MRFRQEKPPGGDEAERRLETEIRQTVSAAGGAGETPPPEPYWQNLIVRTNARIDHATSGRALSISWAARVAIPGVVAIVSFLVGLHYYVPEPPVERVSVASVVLSLPQTVIDSLLMNPEKADPSLSLADIGVDVFELTREQITDYLVANGNTTAAVEGMTDRETTAFLAVLGSPSP